MKLVYQIPRNSLTWLLVAYVLVIAPHVQHLPVWISLASGISLLWRIQVYRGVWRFPPRWIKYLLAGMFGMGLIAGYGRFFGLEPMVALLITGFSLKLLEMHARRDALLVIYLAYFVVVCHLLFDQTIVAAAYVVAVCVLITTALMGLNQSLGHLKPWRTFRKGGSIVLQALPIMLLLFLIAPRIGSLWSIPSMQHAAKTGISDTMSPGNINKLAQSGALAFRVAFAGDIPAQNDLYWRGMVMSRFDGRTWSQARPFHYGLDGAIVDWSDGQVEPWDRLVERRGSPTNYEVILEPSHQPWLYALATPTSASSGVGLARDFRLVNRVPIDSRYQYRVASWLDHTTERSELPDWRKRRELALPAGFNPRTLALAEEWARTASSAEQLMNRVLGLFNQSFVYTLEPPRLGRHTVDEFLFDTQRGFCEHFASSFVVFMRAAGVPARVVAGYQGGEVNPRQNYVMVHQFDAHAWAEVWIAGKGWVRVDPTAAVAPERIEQGFQDFFSDEPGYLSDSLFQLVRYSNLNVINWLRLQMDYLDYAWYRYVLEYDFNIQKGLFERLLGELNAFRMGLFFVLSGIGIILSITFWVWWRNLPPPQKGATAEYLKFCRRLEKSGIARLPQETPAEFASRSILLRPDLRTAIENITHLYMDIIYAQHADKEHELQTAVAEFRPNLTR